MDLSIHVSMITTTTDSYGTHYCVECADNDLLIRPKAENAIAQDEITIDEPEGGEVCEWCGRRINTVPAYRRTYCLKPQMTITAHVEMPAQSAVEALYLFNEAIDEDAITANVATLVNGVLEEGMADNTSLTYTVSETQVKPPPPSRSLVPDFQVSSRPTPSVVSPYRLPSLSQVEACLAIWKATLSTAFPPGPAACAALHFVLAQKEMQPIGYQGYIINHEDNHRAYPHTWLEIRTERGIRIIDWGANLWWENAPFGLFAVGDFPFLEYRGNRILIPPPPPFLRTRWLKALEPEEIDKII